MKIAILGGGFTGLTASYDLVKKKHRVTLFEKEKFLGGLAQGFRGEKWEWSLERAYHHLFASDTDILNFAKEVGFKKIFFRSPETASLYQTGQPTNNYRIFPVDSPQDFLKLPILSLGDRLRSGMVLALLKFFPFLPIYERFSSEKFIRRFMGEKAWKVMWEDLFRKKFGKYAGNILAVFMWARIHKRTKKLGYVEGGFQTFVDYLEEINVRLGVKIQKGTIVRQITKKGDGFIVSGEYFDVVISTLPTPILAKLAETVLPESYTSRFKKLKYLNAVVLIIENREKILDKTYWLNICTPDMPLMFVGQHTNFVEKKHYNNNHLAYVGWYVDYDSPLLRMDEKQLVDFIRPSVKKINPEFKISESKVYLFKAPFAQSIFDKDFLVNKPEFVTPVKNFFIANLDMTYPYDRGTNFAVQLGREVAKLC